MSSPRAMQAGRTSPVPVADAFTHTLGLPLEQIFRRRFGPIPPISGTTQEGEWTTAGQSRIVHLADGGSLREELVSVDAPSAFTYRLTEVTGPMRPLASHIDGAWTFEPAGTGTRITWAWTIHPRNATVGSVTLPVFARLWRAYARRALDELDVLLVGAYESNRPD
jgi:hypothetical protein